LWALASGWRIGPILTGPADQKVYMIWGFFHGVGYKYGASGDFAEAYVLAHEVGHHVQNLLGILNKAQNLKHSAKSQRDENRVQVQVELQADCFAGVWANRAERRFNMLEEGDIEEALNTASELEMILYKREPKGMSSQIALHTVHLKIESIGLREVLILEM